MTEIALEGLVQVTPEGSYKAVLAKDVPTSGNGGLKLRPVGNVDQPGMRLETALAKAFDDFVR